MTYQVDPVMGGRVRLDLGINAEAVHLAFFDHAFACGATSLTGNKGDAHHYRDDRAADLYDAICPVLTAWQARQLAGQLFAAADKAERGAA